MQLIVFDSTNVGELLTHLADNEKGILDFIQDTAPDFEDKIKFNGLSTIIGAFLKTFWYQAYIIDEFLSKRDIGLSQAVSREIKSLYEKSKKVIPDNIENAPDVRYMWIVDQLIPEFIKKSPIHSLKAYRVAAQVIISKYFETCDAYDNPDSVITA